MTHEKCVVRDLAMLWVQREAMIDGDGVAISIVEVVVGGACKEGICLVVAEGFMLGPVHVLFVKPEEVIVAQMFACTNEV
jgi:hypothetical protein